MIKVIFSKKKFGCKNEIFILEIFMKTWLPISACYLNESSDVLIHSGCTQEFYSNRLDLDDHSETLLSFNFGVKSLYHLSVECVEKYLNFDQKSYEKDCLPKVIQDLLRNRSRALKDTLTIRRPLVDGERVFTRTILHTGL